MHLHTHPGANLRNMTKLIIQIPCLNEAEVLPETLAKLGERFELEIAQQLVFPKLYACVSAVSRDPQSGECIGINDPTQPIGGGATPAPFQIEPLDDEPVVRP